MKRYKTTTLILLPMLFLLWGCKSVPKNDQEDHHDAIDRTIYGNYVSEHYTRRGEGYDWVAVSVLEAGEEEIKILVRSRADKKKPTCTFDAFMRRVNNQTFATPFKEAEILVRIEGSTLSISTSKEENRSLLMWFCSGGGSLAGEYEKIDKDLDQLQIDQTPFNSDWQ